MNPKMFEGILNSPARNRYRRFNSATTDQNKVWLLQNEDGEYVSVQDEEGHKDYLLFSDKEFAEYMKGENTVTFLKPMKLLDFVKPLTSQTEIGFMVMPNGKDSFKVDAAKLYCDYFDELKRVASFSEKKFWEYQDFVDSLKQKMKEKQ